jgi:type I restriction-modification system DNA methylase subunit
MTDLQDRMIFTACALVANRYKPGVLTQVKGLGYDTFHGIVSSVITEAIESDRNLNQKLQILTEEYDAVRMAIKEDVHAINNFIDDVSSVSDLINSSHWRGEDVMSIFFNEFNRYRGKSDAGQIFTPDHITSFMYRLIDVHQNDKVLDATCGSGAFLVKSMSEMMNEAGGVNTAKAKEIKQSQLFGIELYRKVFALACANMLIHKDGKTNLRQMDARGPEAVQWIKTLGITKVLMNPPYERKYGCMQIVSNVLNSVPEGTICAFILPDKKLEKGSGRKLLKDHTLMTVIKMPENLFFNVGITTSIFVFEAMKPQNDKNIIGYYIAEDGLETVKNQGRHDVKDKWQKIEDYWIRAIHDGVDYQFSTRQVIDSKKHLSYQMPEKPYRIYEEDFLRTMMDYELYKRSIDVKKFQADILDATMYGNES